MHSNASFHCPTHLSATPARRRRRILAASVAALLLPMLGTPARADRTWDRGAGTNFWTDGANWNLDGLPTSADAVFFTDTGAGTVDLNGTSQPASGSLLGLTFNNATTGFTLQNGGTLFTNSVTNSAGAAVTNTISARIFTNGITVNSGTLALSNTTNVINGPVSIASGATLDVTSPSSNSIGSIGLNGGTLIVRGTNTLSGSNVALTGASTINVQSTTSALGAIGGGGSFTKTGTGTLVLSSTNNYTGNTVIEGGSMQVTGAITSTDQLYVGYSNSGVSLTISGGGTVTDVSGTIGVSAGSANNVATVTSPGSMWTSTGDLNVGFDGDHNTLSIENGGAVQADFTKIGGSTTATDNALNITGTGSSLTNTNDLLVGYGGAMNSLSILDGGQATNLNAFIGYLATADDNSVLVAGPGSVWTNTGTFYLGESGSGNTLTVAGGGKVTVNGAVQDALIGFSVGSDGNSMIVTGFGSEFANDSTFYVGKGGATNDLQVLLGGLVTSKNVRIGGDAGSDGNIATVDGSGSKWNISGTLRVGSGGANNQLQISNGGVVTVTGNSFLGYMATSDGNIVLVDGTGSSLNAQALTIGRLGRGNFVEVGNDGNVTAASITLAEMAGSVGVLQIGLNGAPGTVTTPTITGGLGTALVCFAHDATSYSFAPALNGNLIVLHSGTGNTSLTAASNYTGWTILANGGLFIDNNTALGTGPLFVWSTSGPTTVGSNVAGTNFLNTVEVQSDFSIATNVDVGNPGNQNFTLGGPVILSRGDRTITGVTPAGQVHFSGVISDGGSNLALTLIGTSPYEVFTFEGLSANTYTGLTTVGSGAVLVLNKSAFDGSVAGDVLVTGNGSLDYFRSNQIADTATVTVNSSGFDTAGIHFAGMELRGFDETIANLFGTGTVGLGSGTLTVSAGNFTGMILDGEFGTGGKLTKTGSGPLILSGPNTYTGGTTLDAGPLLAGDDSALGSGLLTINGGTLGSTARNVTLANDVLVNANFNVAPRPNLSGRRPSRLRLAGDVDLGGSVRTITNVVDHTALSLRGAISNGGVAFRARAGNTLDLAIYAGGEVNTYTGLTRVGANVLLALNRQVNDSAIPEDLQIGPGGSVVLVRNEQIGDRSTVRVISSGPSRFPALSGLNLFNRNERIGTLVGHGTIGLGSGGLSVAQGVFAGTIEDGVFSNGGGILQKRSRRTLELTGANTFNGRTVVQQGTLLANNTTGSATGTGRVSVERGGTLGGSGFISGPVVVRRGGHLSPGNSPGTLGTGTLVLTSGSFSDFELGAPFVIGGASNDLVNVTGDLRIDGTLNVIDAGAFAPGAYRLFNYTGTLTDNTFDFGTLPTGYVAGDFTIQTAMVGAVNLLAKISEVALFWDGAGTANDGTISGGAGTWNATNGNWANSTGTFNLPWPGTMGIFGAPGGTVTVDGTLGFEALQFMDNGYVVTATAGSALTPTGAAKLTIDQGVTTEFSAPLTGGGSLEKLGAGTLVLSGANSYAGGTTISAGILQIGNGGTTGSIVGNVTDNAVLAFNRSDAMTFSGVISGSGAVRQLGTGTTTLTAANTYAGGTTITAGILKLGDGSTPGASVGTGGVTVGSSGTFTLDLASGETFANSILDNGLVTVGGALLSNYTVSSAISGSGVLRKEGGNAVTLTGASSYSGGTAINAGTLRTQNAKALGNGPVALNAGVLVPTGALNVGAFAWTGGNVRLAPAAADIVNVTGALTNGGSGGAFQLDTAGLTPGTFTLATFGTTNFALGDFSAQLLNVPANVAFQGQFLLNATSVQFTLAGATATGPLLQNSAPVNIPTFAIFIVNGPVQTGGPGESNTVQSLIFAGGSSLGVSNNLTVTSGNFDVPTGSATIFGGNVIAPGSFSKIGAGTLDAMSDFFVAGPANVQAGALLVDGNFTAGGGLTVSPGALLGGNGFIFGTVVNNGTTSPGKSPGTLTIKGDFTQSGSGALRIEIGGRKAGQFDLLQVGGHASLDGTLQLVRLNNFHLKRGDRIIFLTASQGVDGEFAHVSNPFTSDTILEPTMVYHDHSVALEMVQGSFAEFAGRAGLTPNQRAVAGALDEVAFDKDADKLIAYLDDRKLEKLPGDFDKIAPEELTSIFTISTSLAQVQSVNLQRRTDDLRSGASGFSSGLTMQGNAPSYASTMEFRAGAAGPTGSESKESKEVLTPAPDNRWGVFLTGVGEWVDVGGDGNARGYDITTGGFTLGLDYKVCSNFAVGIAAGYAGTGVDLTDDGSVLVNGGKLALYATTFVGGWYADAAVTGGYNSYDTKRSALQGTARGSTDGGELNVLVGTGYDWKLGALQIGPTATFNYTLVGIDGYTEHGSLAPLDIASRNAESVRSAFGFKSSYDWKLGGVIVKPEIRAAWQHEYGDRSYDLSASFTNGAGGNFLVNGPEIGRDSLLLGAGFAVQCTERCSTYLYYDGELGRTRYDSHSVAGGIRIAF
jgi:autotransporter-associated beta strand protein/T5SS/PEP-CTERM-associated repeat protein